MNNLLYHHAGSTGGLSPFDEAILRVAANGPVGIVSPYIGVPYLERIISLSGEWRLVSDVEAWLSSLSVRARVSAWGFIRKHVEHIHHYGSLHAKVIVGKGLAVMGSANLTRTGITARTEMGILLDDPSLVSELGDWFDMIWRGSSCPVMDETSAFVQWLDEQAAKSSARRERFILSGTGRRVRARLVRMQEALKGRPYPVPVDTPLDLNRVAESVIAAQEVHYATLERTVEAAVEALSLHGPFGLRDVMARGPRRFRGCDGTRGLPAALPAMCQPRPDCVRRHDPQSPDGAPRRVLAVHPRQRVGRASAVRHLPRLRHRAIGLRSKPQPAAGEYR